jgi:hypothetical protein
MFRYVTGARVALVALVCASSAFAQRDLSTLAGTITDTTGVVVANAKVTITEVDTGESYVTTTNSVGEFVRPALKAATYTVKVTAPGFKTSEQKDVVLTPGERTGINITLTVGDINQTIEVAASAPLLQTESTQVGAALNTSLVGDVPLGGTRNLTYLARLSPGVVPAEPGARDSANGGFSANGVRSNGQNNFLLNGVDNNINTIDFLNQTSYAMACNCLSKPIMPRRREPGKQTVGVRGLFRVAEPVVRSKPRGQHRLIERLDGQPPAILDYYLTSGVIQSEIPRLD